jgi:hypothetical protein
LVKLFLSKLKRQLFVSFKFENLEDSLLGFLLCFKVYLPLGCPKVSHLSGVVKKSIVALSLQLECIGKPDLGIDCLPISPPSGVRSKRQEDIAKQN